MSFRTCLKIEVKILKRYLKKGVKNVIIMKGIAKRKFFIKSVTNGNDFLQVYSERSCKINDLQTSSKYHDI